MYSLTQEIQLETAANVLRQVEKLALAAEALELVAVKLYRFIHVIVQAEKHGWDQLTESGETAREAVTRMAGEFPDPRVPSINEWNHIWVVRNIVWVNVRVVADNLAAGDDHSIKSDDLWRVYHSLEGMRLTLAIVVESFGERSNW